MPKTKSDNRTVEIKMDTIDIQTYTIISGSTLNLLPTKKNDCGTDQLFQVLDGKQLEYIFQISRIESLKAGLEI